MSAPVALVTGGARRVGRSIVKALHADGYRVAIHYRHAAAEADELARDLSTLTPSSSTTAVATFQAVLDETMEGDLADRCSTLINDVVGTFGRLDVLVHSASSFFPTPLLSGAGEEKGAAASSDVKSSWDLIMGSNAMAPYLLTRAFARHVATRDAISPDKKGHADQAASSPCMVFVTDSMLERPMPSFAVYTMAKHALHGLMIASAMELAPLGIRVNAVAPGYNVFPDSGMDDDVKDGLRREVPLGHREGSPDEVAEAVRFLASSKTASYITGQTIAVDGGLFHGRNTVWPAAAPAAPPPPHVDDMKK